MPGYLTLLRNSHPAERRTFDEQVCHVGRRDRDREEVALRQMAIELLQSVDLFGLLHSFGDRCQPEGVGEFDDGADHHVSATATDDSIDERLVDLDDVEGELDEVGE